jgi:hypothetical protein
LYLEGEPRPVAELDGRSLRPHIGRLVEVDYVTTDCLEGARPRILGYERQARGTLLAVSDDGSEVVISVAGRTQSEFRIGGAGNDLAVTRIRTAAETMAGARNPISVSKAALVPGVTVRGEVLYDATGLPMLEPLAFEGRLVAIADRGESARATDQPMLVLELLDGRIRAVALDEVRNIESVQDSSAPYVGVSDIYEHPSRRGRMSNVSAKTSV